MNTSLGVCSAFPCFVAEGCAYLGLQVKAINCISPCLCPVLIGFNLLSTRIQKSVIRSGHQQPNTHSQTLTQFFNPLLLFPSFNESNKKEVRGHCSSHHWEQTKWYTLICSTNKACHCLITRALRKPGSHIMHWKEASLVNVGLSFTGVTPNVSLSHLTLTTTWPG
jgi:hypothetical protein